MIKYNNNMKFPTIMSIIKTQKVKKMDLDEEVTKLIQKITEEAKNYISDINQYRNINVSVRNTFNNIYGKAFGLTIEQTPDKTNRHFLSMNLLHPSMELQSTRTIAAGDKAEIIKTLENKDFIKAFKNNLQQMSEKMEER